MDGLSAPSHLARVLLSNGQQKRRREDIVAPTGPLLFASSRRRLQPNHPLHPSHRPSSLGVLGGHFTLTPARVRPLSPPPAAVMSPMPATHGHSQPCCNIPPVVAKGYSAKGSYEQIAGRKTCMSLPPPRPQPRLGESAFSRLSWSSALVSRCALPP